jgi:hypothetical protein
MTKEFWRGVWRSKAIWWGHVTAIVGIVTLKYPKMLTVEELAAWTCISSIVQYIVRINTAGTLKEKGK